MTLQELLLKIRNALKINKGTGSAVSAPFGEKPSQEN